MKLFIMTTNYSLLELLFLYGCYAVLGHLMEQVLCLIAGIAAKRGLLRGPWGVLYGIGGLLSGCVIGPHLPEFPQSLLVLCIVCFVLDLAAILLIRCITGVAIWRPSIVMPLASGFLCVVLVESLQEYILKVMDVLPALVLFLALVAFYVLFLRDAIDAAAALLTFRSELRSICADAEKARQAGLLASASEEDREALIARLVRKLSPYGAWLLGYPRFFAFVSDTLGKALGRELALAVLRGVMLPK